MQGPRVCPIERRHLRGVKLRCTRGGDAARAVMLHPAAPARPLDDHFEHIVAHGGYSSIGRGFWGKFLF
jgi:hypothetical protein